MLTITLLIALLFSINIKSVFYITFLILLAGFSKLYLRYVNVQLGFEFIFLSLKEKENLTENQQTYLNLAKSEYRELLWLDNK